jgi:hypothetical protein
LIVSVKPCPGVTEKLGERADTVKFGRVSNSAVTVMSEFMVRMQLAVPAGAHGPPQVANPVLVSGTGVRNG